MKISVIIPTLNGGKKFCSCIESLVRQQTINSWEIIIIDSGTNDNSLKKANELLKKAKIPSKFLRIKKNEFSHGSTRNLAISESSGDIFCLLTQDAIPKDEYWLSNLTKPYFKFDNISATFGRHNGHLDHPQLLSRNLTNHFNYMNSRELRFIENYDEYRNNEQLRQFLHFFSNNNSSISRSSWELNPFPSVEFGEDQLWARQSLENGAKIMYCDDAIVYHSHNYNLFDVYKRAKVEMDYYLKHFGYDLSSSKYKFFYRVFSLIKSDISWLRKEKFLNFEEVLCLLRLHIGTQIAHSFTKIKKFQ